MTPFDNPHAELAWMFLQSVSEGGDTEEGFALLSDDFTYWSIITRACFDKETFRRANERRRQIVEINIDLRRCVTEGDTVVVEAQASGTSKDGVEYDTPFVCIFETRDGQIVSMREYSDTKSAAVFTG
ncbi:nuclear transport factor 2 family protein [Mycobacterium sp. 663a-19]|uniref:nuclear transport factor 2 family protein n=1 Tax=Mycobacterium sp. 663a-19 TaxID=2986148 RepID=UPI002D1EFF37|nr:nuclear transport factor 2 family protein [Mycobacterium sp. 663a-19]MEB3980629.1 nuclear transport factor 2 family protein [Mycobacterium sp. 663a-19]